MKLLNQQIDMISWTSKDGNVTPVRFRMEQNGQPVVVKVGKVLRTETHFFGGSPILLFRCSTLCGREEKLFELSYHCNSQKWLLKKI